MWASILVPLRHPLLVVRLLEFAQSLAKLFDRLEAPHPQDVGRLFVFDLDDVGPQGTNDDQKLFVFLFQDIEFVQRVDKVLHDDVELARLDAEPAVGLVRRSRWRDGCRQGNQRGSKSKPKFWDRFHYSVLPKIQGNTNRYETHCTSLT
jgi:hypothetical protein